MLQTTSAGYVGAFAQGAYAGYTTSDTFFCTLEVYEGFSKEQGDILLSQIKAFIDAQAPNTLQAFDNGIISLIQKANVPVEFSLSSGYLHDSVLYLKCIGSGQIGIKRGSHFELIITGDNTASGCIKEQDVFVFSSSVFMEASRGKEYVAKLLHHAKEPMQIVQRIADDPVEGRDETGVALFTLFQKKMFEKSLSADFMVGSTEISVQKPLFTPQIRSYLIKLKENKKKLLLLGGVLIVFIVLLLNITNMFGKKQNASTSATSGSVMSAITDELKGLYTSNNIDQALGVIIQARQQLRDLAKTDKKISKIDVAQTENLINQTESQVLKREEKTPEEFFDLGLEEQGAKGDKMSLSADKATILNKTGKIYLLSLETKSIEKKAYSEILNADIVASFDTSIFFYRSGVGIYKIDAANKPKRIIKDDKEWGNIQDMNVYNGNIYLLDTGKGDIYKYLVAQDGYSDKNFYVQSSNAVQFKKANSLSIDSAVYIGFDTFILKYLSGAQQTFKSQFPGGDANLVKTFTSKDTDKVFALDKSKGIMYILTKDGDYVKQIHSTSFNKTDDFVIYKNAIYLLSQAKVLKISF